MTDDRAERFADAAMLATGRGPLTSAMTSTLLAVGEMEAMRAERLRYVGHLLAIEIRIRDLMLERGGHRSPDQNFRILALETIRGEL